MTQFISLFQAAIMFGSVILFGALGEILTERSGNLNLGVPGIMYLGGIAGLTYGPLKGVSYTIAREIVGVVDIVTFPFPLPGCPDDPNDAGWGYGPIMRPAWVVDIQHNWGDFVYDSNAIVSSDY